MGTLNRTGSTTWATSWSTLVGNTSTTYVSAWNGGWLGPVPIAPPDGSTAEDLNLGWDSVRNRFVFTLLGTGSSPANVWYGHSTDATGTQWMFGNRNTQGTPQPVIPGAGISLDYPSIGVDASGRIIIGAWEIFPGGYFATVSTDGEHFALPGPIPLSNAGALPGSQSRVVAAGHVFEAFVPALDGSTFLPNSISRYQSSDGVNWTSPFLVENFSMPMNNVQPSGSNHPIFYAPLLSAAGYPDGRWIVGFQRNIGGWNNMDICTSDRGCGTVNAASDDQFLAGVSASADGYWVSYHTYYTPITRSLPLMTQALYFKTGASGIGATTNMGCSAQNCIDPTSWALSGTAGVLPTSRCRTSQCYALGDFDTPSSNQFAASHTPYLVRSSRLNDLFQAFVQDPSGTANVPNFVPNFIYHPIGSDLSFEGLPVPPESWAVDPRLW